MQEPRIASSVKGSQIDIGVLRSEIERAILDTRRFDVLTREGADFDAMALEADIEANRHGDSGSVGTPISGEYIAIPTVTSFSMYSSFRKIPNIDGKWKRTDQGSMSVEVQILEANSGRIKDTFSYSDAFKADHGVVLSNHGAPAKSSFVRLAKNVASKISAGLIDSVYPVVILQLTDGVAYLNRGDGTGVKVGQRMSVFRPGEELIDPTTGDNLGTTETYVGEIEITRVNPKTSQAKIIKENSPGAVKKLDLVRKK